MLRGSIGVLDAEVLTIKIRQGLKVSRFRLLPDMLHPQSTECSVQRSVPATYAALRRSLWKVFRKVESDRVFGR